MKFFLYQKHNDIPTLSFIKFMAILLSSDKFHEISVLLGSILLGYDLLISYYEILYYSQLEFLILTESV